MSSECIDVEKLYANDNELKKEDVRILQEWLKKQPHLPQLEDKQVIVFLHSCYYRIEATKTTIDNYFTMKTHYPELFNSLPEDTLRNTLSVTFVNILPKKTPQEYVVLLIKLVDFNADKYNFCDAVNVVNMVSTFHIHQHGFETGILAVFDCKGFTFSHLARFNLSALKHLIDHVQEGAPVRIKGIHFINIVPVLDKVISIIKPLMKNELFNMVMRFKYILLSIHFTNMYQVTACLRIAAAAVLLAKFCQVASFIYVQIYSSNYDFFKWHDAQKVDESKRLGQSSSSFGVDGTFKMLEID